MRKTQVLAIVTWIAIGTPRTALRSQDIVINEVLASNVFTNADEDGDSSDWIELKNIGSRPLDLFGYALGDDPSGMRKWIFPEATILQPGGFLLVWCSGKDRERVSPEKLAEPGAPIPFEPSLVGLDADWAYLVGTPDAAGPPGDWRESDFDDSAWPRGKPGFGFNDDDDRTVLPEDIGAVFLRQRFVHDPARDLPNLVFRVNYDDGFVLYLNGVRVLSQNFPDGEEPGFASLANRSHEARAEEKFDITDHIGLLRPGENVLAAVILNQRVSSNDLSFIPELGWVHPVLHTNFQLDREGESLFLIGLHGENTDAVELPPQVQDQSWGRAPDGSGEHVYFRFPSPIEENSAPWSTGPMVVADTTFSVDRGFYDAPIEVEITTETPDATIRYTTDGTTPTGENGLVYTGPLGIGETTTLRAAAFKEGYAPTNVDTHTYIFLDDILRQDVPATLRRGFPSRWGSTTADYGMDPDVVSQDGKDRFGGRFAATIRDDLLALPTLSIVLNIDDMFGPQGIYTLSGNRGEAWERPASVEMINPDGSEGFQIDCGIRIQGGAFRSHGLTKKHSFRLLFKRIYGEAKLEFPIFGPEATAEFDTITLRSNSNDGWQWDAAAAQPIFIRDSFGRETTLAMGEAASHELFTHVYINGVYWGLYNPVERPDHAFGASYFGGDKDDWDSMSNGEITNGSLEAWNTLRNLAARGLASNDNYFAIQGKNPDGTDNPELENYLDVDNMIDYMITNLWVGNTDWPHKNYWVGRSRVDSTGFKFYMWDSEWSMGLRSSVTENRVGVSDGVAAPYAACKTNREFRVRFGDHVHRHFFNGGALHVDPENSSWDPDHPERNVPAARFVALGQKVERAVVAESARWGDQHRALPYTADDWRREFNRQLQGYLPARSRNVLAQFRSAGLYPSVEAPEFNHRGGRIPRGFPLEISAPAGEIYYTLDGSDPRLIGGDVHGEALRVEGPEAVALVPADSEVRVLVPQDDSLGLEWTKPDFDHAAWDRGPAGVGFDPGGGFEDLIQIDVGAEMHDINASVYIRMPFAVGDLELEKLSSWTLRMRYDDGFVAYLNGSAIASANAPEVPSWNSDATRTNSDSRAVLFEDFPLEGVLELLREGENVLAIHGMNSSAGNDDMLVQAELVGFLPPEGDRAIALNETTIVKSRALANGSWSALNEATFFVDENYPLRITELMYHPADPPAASGYQDDDFEFIELQNVGEEDLVLPGIRLKGGVEFDFIDSLVPILEPGGVVVLGRSLLALTERYEIAAEKLGGEYRGRLSNRGERLVLTGPQGETLLDFGYSDQWYPTTDGLGHSLEILDSSALPDRWARRDGWRASARVGGTPGTAPIGPADGGFQVAGDINQDGSMNLADTVALLLQLFGRRQAALPCEGEITSEGNRALLDLNGDLAVDASDAVAMLVYLFLDGSPPRQGTGCVRLPKCPDLCSLGA